MTQVVLTAHNYSTRAIEIIVETIKSMVQKYKADKQIRETLKELRALSDRELNDIGINRGDIYSIAHGDTSFKRVTSVEQNTNLKGWV